MLLPKIQKIHICCLLSFLSSVCLRVEMLLADPCSHIELSFRSPLVRTSEHRLDPRLTFMSRF